MDSKETLTVFLNKYCQESLSNKSIITIKFHSFYPQYSKHLHLFLCENGTWLFMDWPPYATMSSINFDKCLDKAGSCWYESLWDWNRVRVHRVIDKIQQHQKLPVLQFEVVNSVDKTFFQLDSSSFILNCYFLTRTALLINQSKHPFMLSIYLISK